MEDYSTFHETIMNCATYVFTKMENILEWIGLKLFPPKKVVHRYVLLPPEEETDDEDKTSNMFMSYLKNEIQPI